MSWKTFLLQTFVLSCFCLELFFFVNNHHISSDVSSDQMFLVKLRSSERESKFVNLGKTRGKSFKTKVVKIRIKALCNKSVAVWRQGVKSPTFSSFLTFISKEFQIKILLIRWNREHKIKIKNWNSPDFSHYLHNSFKVLFLPYLFWIFQK